MDLFGGEKRRSRLELEKQIAEIFRKIIIFPGSKSEFEDFVGYKTAWIDSGQNNKGLIIDTSRDDPLNYFSDFYDFDFQKKIADSGIVALVDSTQSFAGLPAQTYYFGMPVRKQ